MLYAWIVLVVTGWFAGVVGRSAARGRAAHNIAWAVSLLMAFVATAAYLATLYWYNPWTFRLYYLFGAMLMAAYMGLGSLHLEAGRQARARRGGGAASSRAAGRFPSAVRWITWAVLFCSVGGAALLATLPVDPGGLATLNGGPGSGLIPYAGWTGGLWLADTILLNTFGVLALVGVALVSAWRAYTGRAGAELAWANALIALGGILLGVAGTAARVGFPGAFWVTMAVGWIVVYAGFARVTVVVRQLAAGAATVRPQLHHN